MDRSRRRAAEDTVSGLDANILAYIVSLLSFQEAGRTSVLAKRWRNVWRRSRTIEFNQNFFVKRGESDQVQDDRRRAVLDFARQFILEYEQPEAQPFSLTCPVPENFQEDVRNFIVFAARRRVRNLEVDFSNATWIEETFENGRGVFDLPLAVYADLNLESLKLFSCTFHFPFIQNFKVLKSLSLGWIEISLRALNSVLSGCAMLETLSLKICWNSQHFEIIKAGLKLKNLVLDKCNFGRDYLHVEGLNLKYFKYSGIVGTFYLDYQRELEEAELDFQVHQSFEDELGESVCSLLGELFAPRVLTVCSVLLQIIPHNEEPAGFVNLNVRHLIMKTAMHPNEFCGIKFMLRGCRLLGTLTIDIYPHKIFPDYEPPCSFNFISFWSENAMIILPCLAKTLRVVNVKGFRGRLNEFSLLVYILRTGRVLQQLNLYLANEDFADGEQRSVCSRGRTTSEGPKECPPCRHKYLLKGEVFLHSFLRRLKLILTSASNTFMCYIIQQ